MHFGTVTGEPVLRARFDSVLRGCLLAANLGTGDYKGHSFRIGRATDCAAEGMSDAQIRALGRWSSDAFRKHIRVS